MLAESLLPEFDHEMASTRKLLERIPDDKLDWRPHDKSWTLQELVTHVANIPTWVATTVDQDELDMGQDFPTPETGGRDVTVRTFDRNVAEAREKIGGAGDEELMKPWTLRSGDQVHMTLPKIAVLRSFVMNHLIHHRGQLTVYMRENDVPLPSIYGPSADEQAF